MTAENLEAQIHQYWEEFQQRKISKGDFVSLYLILCNQLFPSLHWLSWSASRRHTEKDFSSYVYPKKEDFWKDHPFFKRVPEAHSLGMIINQSVFKKETLRATLGLMHVFTRPETVHILDYIPSPLQLLEMQSQGFRCVTLLRTKKWFSHQFDHKRNLRDFVIHDLEHIWQMFENPALTQAQIRFSKQLLELTQQGHFDFIRNNSEFAKEFDYIISDMNTHPAHMYATLKSLVSRTKNAANSSPHEFQDHEIHAIMKPFDDFVS